MSDAAFIALGLLGGAVLGGLFFGGLWWTVRRVPEGRSPAALVLGSFVIRTAAVLAGFYFISGADWKRLLTCLAGFLLTRFFIMRRVRADLASGLESHEANREADPPYGADT